MPIDAINKKVGDSGLSGNLPMDNPVVAEALRKANVQDAHKILTEYGVITNVDLEKFLSERHNELMNVHIQPEPIYASSSSVAPPPMDAFPMHDSQVVLNTDDLKVANDGFTKAMTVGKAAASESTGKSTSTINKDNVDQTIQDWNDFYDSVEQKLLEGSLLAETQAKSEELEAELRKLVEMAKSGQIEDPCLLIIAYTKVNVNKYGIEAAKESINLMRETNKQNRLVETLKNSSTTSDTAAYYEAKQGLDESKNTYQQSLTNFESITRFITESMNTADSMIKSVNNTRAEIIRKIAASG